MTGDAANFTLGASATLESNMPNLPVKLYIDDKEVLRLSYRYHESTYIEAASIDLKPLQSAYYDYTSLLNTQATNAISTGEVYWAALRALGYRDVSEVEALLPLPDLVLPDNIFDISTVDAIERYAMYIAYLRSLDDWFDNSTYADHIRNMTIADVNFTSVPTIARGRIYDDSSAEWTEYLKTIWVIPETGSVTLHVGENNTLGVICNICYQVNSTGGIVYFYGQPNDLVEVTELYVRDTSGYYHNVTSTTITTTSLYTYTITYDENQGLDFPPPTLGEPNLIIILVVLIAGVYLLGQFAKGTGRRYRKYY
jgi:hypothetical protein